MRLPSEGRSPGNEGATTHRIRPNGPTVSLPRKMNDWTVGPPIRDCAKPSCQGCALRWVNCWAFGPTRRDWASGIYACDPKRVLAGTDCGFDTSAGQRRVAEDVVWAKLAALAEGARIASARLF